MDGLSNSDVALLSRDGDMFGGGGAFLRMKKQLCRG